MAIKAKLKFKGDMPWELEKKLINKFGFRVFQRGGREFMIVEKVKPMFKPEVLVNGELPEDIQNNLNKRCTTIVSHFLDPDANEPLIRIRLGNLANCLPPLQKKYIKDWIVSQFGEEDENAEDYSAAV